jgi:hypothetical protein
MLGIDRGVVGSRGRGSRHPWRSTQRILQRAHVDFGDPQCQRLAALSAAQWYRLRKRRADRQQLAIDQPTRPTMVEPRVANLL